MGMPKSDVPDCADAVLMRELEYRTPILHSPVNSRRSPESFGDFRTSKNKTILQ